jgi:tetratricopeptide (TPR) repeat protein
VPLAWDIAQECKKKAAEYGRTADPSNNSSMDTYSHWLEKAYPQAVQRQRYFRKLIEGKPISHANFRLAHLLSEKQLATLVVTPNFDDFLSRALTLFGQPHIVCDHPNTVERIDPESKEIQIVHVHGTYWFYDCCNLRGEIEARTEDSRERAVTMTSFLDTVLSRHSAIVIGYAGWEGDVIMNALKRRLLNGLPNNLYWFCYRRSGLDSLRSFLKSMKNHRDVCLVFPPAPAGEPSSQIASGEKLPAIAIQREPTLTAQSVLDSLVGAFTRESPALTVDPIGFFAKQLANAFPLASSERSEEDIYDLRSVINRVELVRAHGEEKPSPTEAAIERVRDANRRSEYQEAIQIAHSIDPQALDEEQRQVLLDLVLAAASGLDDNSDDELKAYEMIVLVGAAQDAGRVIAPKIALTIAMALVNKGITLGQLGLTEEAIEAYDEIVRRFSGAPETAVREQVAKALVNKGVRLGELSRSEEEIAAYDEVYRRFGDASELALREFVAKALLNEGITFGELGRPEKAVEVYDKLARRFHEAPESSLHELVAKALLNKGITLGSLKRSEEEIDAYNEVLRRFADATEPALRELAGRAALNKGITLGQVNRNEESIVVYNDILRRFGDAPELESRELVAKAVFHKGLRLRQLDRSEEAISAYDEVVRRVGDEQELELRESAVRAMYFKGIALSHLTRNEEAIVVYGEIVSRFGDQPELKLRETVAKALLNKGLVLNTLKRGLEARQSFQEVVTRYADSPETVLQEVVKRAKAELVDGDAGAETTS